MDILITGEDQQDQHEDEVFEDNTEGAVGVGSLSFEGVGGNCYQLSSNREFELQNKVSQLEFLLARLREELRREAGELRRQIQQHRESGCPGLGVI